MYVLKFSFSSITREICNEIKNKLHHVNQLIEADLMMYIHMTFPKKKHSTPLHSTELFKIFFSLLTLSTAFLQKACGPCKSITFLQEKCIVVPAEVGGGAA